MTNKLKSTDILKNKEGAARSIDAVELAELQKQAARVADLEKAAKENQEKLDAAATEAAELNKSLEAEKNKVVEFEKAKEQSRKDEMVEIVKSFTFVSEDEQENVVTALLKARKVEGTALILEQLNKAQEAIDSFATTEHGSDESVDVEKSKESDDEWDKTASDVFKSRKQAK